MRDLTSIVANVLTATKLKMDRNALIKAHEAAAEWHQALADALTAEADIEEATHEARTNRWPALREDWACEIPGHEKSYRDAIGRAGVAMQNVPIRWLAVEGLPVDGANVVPFKTAAE